MPWCKIYYGHWGVTAHDGQYFGVAFYPVGSLGPDDPDFHQRCHREALEALAIEPTIPNTWVDLRIA